MKEIYTIEDLRAWRAGGPEREIRLGAVGDPVAHSLSPAMQNAALQALGIDARDAAFQVRAPELAEAMAAFRALGFLGLNVTVPHKVAALRLVDEVDQLAAKIGAINTIAFRDGRSIGSNTDAPGFSRAVREVFGRALGEMRVLIMGAGGAGRAIAFQCRRECCPEILIGNRSSERAKTLADELKAKALPWDEMSRNAREVDLVVNATPLGLGAADVSPIVTPEYLSGRYVFDIVYGAHETALVKQAKAHGARATDGRAMLLHQGALAFAQWFGLEPPLEVMRAALRS